MPLTDRRGARGRTGHEADDDVRLRLLDRLGGGGVTGGGEAGAPAAPARSSGEPALEVVLAARTETSDWTVSTSRARSLNSSAGAAPEVGSATTPARKFMLEERKPVALGGRLAPAPAPAWVVKSGSGGEEGQGDDDVSLPPK